MPLSLYTMTSSGKDFYQAISKKTLELRTYAVSDQKQWKSGQGQGLSQGVNPAQ